ncbi:MalY/PatB family protein [Roseomonas sp. CCTCC AB2023176]|uniref:MalY/PatB family protein n=1 Tax=Roseomonas sp. CCTCC AB2023176 TaxID=3342640 RepID=UPI0035D6EDB7
MPDIHAPDDHSFDFETVIERRGTACSKWTRYGNEVLPLWVADTDFAAPPPVLAALRNRMEHPIFGYAVPDAAVREAIVGAMARDHGWSIAPEDIVFIPGVVAGFNMALRALCQPGDGVLVQTPLYPPMLAAPGYWGMERVEVPLRADAQGAIRTDMEAFRAGLARSRAVMLCHPHNPLGHVYSRDELEEIARAALDAGAWIISDEIHCDLLYDGHRHVPIATLSPEVAARTVTLMSAGKTYNLAGLKASFAIITDPDVRRRFDAQRTGLVDSLNPFGLEATRSAFADCAPWRAALLRYLTANRDHLMQQMAARFPGIRVRKPEGTFLAWLDCRDLDLGDPQRFFLERARVAFNPGPDFGAAEGTGHVRLNFGCPRATLDAALDRMEDALRQR